MVDNSKEYILCAAVKRLDGGIDYGYRHNNIYERVPQSEVVNVYGIDIMEDMGFLTSKNRFVGRKEAYSIALNCGQVDESSIRFQDPEMRFLTSEDLY